MWIPPGSCGTATQQTTRGAEKEGEKAKKRAKMQSACVASSLLSIRFVSFFIFLNRVSVYANLLFLTTIFWVIRTFVNLCVTRKSLSILAVIQVGIRLLFTHHRFVINTVLDGICSEDWLLVNDDLRFSGSLKTKSKLWFDRLFNLAFATWNHSKIHNLKVRRLKLLEWKPRQQSEYPGRARQRSRN